MSPPPVVPAGWTATVDRELALQHGAPHAVVSQVLRPDVAACLPTDAVKLRSAQDAQCCVTALSLGADNVMSTSDVEFAAGLPHLTEVDLSTSAVNLMGVASLSKLRHLRTLRLVNCDHIEATPVPTIELLELQHLDLSGCNLPLTILCLPVITTLVLVRGQYVDSALCSQIVCRFPTLRHVDLDRCWDVDAACLAEIAKLPQLECLCVGYAHKVNGVALAQIAGASTLRRLELNCCWNIPAVGFEELTKLPNLESLSVPRSVTSVEAFASIATLTALVELDARFCHVVDDSLMQIAKLPQLRRLNLSNATIFNVVSLEHLGGMPRLCSLDLRRCAITAEQVASVRHVPELLVDVRRIDVSHCPSPTA